MRWGRRFACPRSSEARRPRAEAGESPGESPASPRRCVAALILLSFTTAAAAADPVAYSRRVWQSADGLPEDFAQAVAQTQDGYLWVGTSGGLVRFDGTRFTIFNRENQPAFRDPSVYCLFTARDGTLWIGSEGGGLIRYRAGIFRAYGATEGLTNGFVRVVFEDRSGNLWVGTDQGLFRMRQDRLERIDGTSAIPRLSVHSIWQDRANRLLVGGSGLLVLTEAGSVYYRSTQSQADNGIRTIRETSDGTLWIGTISGLRRLPGGLAGDPFPTPRMIDGNIGVLLPGRQGHLWIGAYGQGLMRYDAGNLVRFTAPTYLPHNNVLALFEDGEEDVWVGTQGGLLRLSPSAATTITTAGNAPESINTIYQDPHGPLYVAALNGRLFEVRGETLAPAALPPAAALPVRNLFRDRAGNLWIGTDGQGIALITNSTGVANSAVHRLTTTQGLVNDFVRAFSEDPDGAIWIGTDGGLSRFHAGAFRNFTTQDGLAYNSVRALLRVHTGDLWIATDGGLSRYRAGAFMDDAATAPLRGQKIWALYEDPHGGLWIGTHGAGLYLLENGKLAQFTVRNGLPSNQIHFIAEDAAGSLWMSGPSGIVAVLRGDLENSARDPARQLAVRIFGTSEGLLTNQMNGGVQPAGAITPSGEFWFASTKGAVRIRPGAPDRGSRPTVLIEEALADGSPEPFAHGLRAGPGEGKLELHYTAIRLRSPERTRFKYWMEGFERDWNDAGQRHIAYYTNLTGGTYRFHVVAYDRHDPRNAAEQILAVEWRPHFYQTAWFLALCAAAAIAGAWGAYRLHLRNLGRRFAAVLDERNRLAREMHDTLIQGCVGVSALLEAASSAQDVSAGISRELLDRARNEVRTTVDEARLAVWNLRKGSTSGESLAAAVAGLVERISLETGIQVDMHESGTPRAIDAEAERSLLLLIREALHNAARHAAPQNLTVTLRFEPRTVSVEIADDGCGFDPSIEPEGHHYGLIGMRERVEKLGGQFRISSVPGQGTRVGLTVPAGRQTG